MQYVENVIELIGNTPLVRMNKLVGKNAATVLLKMEQLNPGGSVKDRIGFHMIQRAEEAGILKPGATIVESTSGNTGLGLAMTAAVKGYRCVCTLPDKMSQEKIDMLKAFGVEVVITPTDVPHDSPEGYVEVAKRIARETPNAWYVDQYGNQYNPEAHYLTTGPEVWEQTEGEIDYFIAGAGTGGTVSGAGKYLKEKAKEAGKELKVVAPDPVGSMYYDVFYGREPKTKVYKVEGIGHDFMVDTLDFSVIDEIRQVSDKQAFLAVRRLAREEGIFVGGSAGINLYSAIEIANEVGPGKVIVVILCDHGDRYISKVFNDEWMKDLGYLDLDERLGTVKDLLSNGKRQVELASEADTLESVAARMQKSGISQMPLCYGSATPNYMVHESDVLQALISGRAKPSDQVKLVAKPLEGKIQLSDSVSSLQEVFSGNNVAVVFDGEELHSIISRIDMIGFLSGRLKHE